MQKGEPWGSEDLVPAGVVVVRSDAEARQALESARHERRPVPVLGLLGGDLCRTVGGRGDEARLRPGATATVLPCDLGEALLDGKVRLFVAHVVVRGRSRWRGSITAAMNAQYVGRYDVAPRAHPGDGVLDVVEVDTAMSLGDRWKAWRRLPSGTHVPHPRITTRRMNAVQLDVAGQRVEIDGEVQPPARTLSVRVEPGALAVVV